MMLKDKVVVVTGAANGIGRGIARRAMVHGARAIWVSDLSTEPRGGEQSTVDMLRAGGAKAEFFRADISKKGDLEALVAATEADGGVDVMVCNAGIALSGDGLEVAPEDIRSIVAVNFEGTLFSAQVAAAQMERLGKEGSIVLTGSMGGIRGSALSVAYCGTKGGVHALTMALADGLGPKGIRVNAVAPGFIETELLKSFPETMEAAQATLPRIPLRRLGQPEDVGDAVAWLGSDYSAFVTGITLLVDGGQASITPH
ncbi:MAG: SDR family NAD(P)-dependent oxidoreductase [Sphingobium sp.]